MSRKTYYNIPVRELAKRFGVPEDALLRALLEERAREGSPLEVCTFLNSRPVSPMPADVAERVINRIKEIVEELRAGLINPLDLLD